MLELAASFYTHDTTGGFIIVSVVCGAMFLWCLWIAYTNFGPPAKRRKQLQR